MEIVLDARRFKGRTRAHAYLKEALRLPDYYGKNLDALYDCLGDIGEETVIVVPEVIQKKEYLGDYGKTMLRVFKDAAEVNTFPPILKQPEKEKRNCCYRQQLRYSKCMDRA